jgi:hypothetical protein
LNTYTGNYWFFSIRQSPNALEFSLAHTAAAGDQVFGAFKGGARNAYCSMCRLIFMDFVNLKTLLEWPAGWFCEKFPNKVRFPRSALRKEGPALDQLVADYWAGVSDCILDTFYQRYKSRTLPGFAVQLHASDLNCLETFYTSSLLRHAKIRSQGKGSSALVSKDELDDLLLIHRHTETNSLNKGANRSSVPGKRSLS